MKYTEEIFNILSKGGFISSNSISTQVKRYYDAIEEDLPDYYEYYQGIGLYLEGGDGYYHFTRKEAKVDLERKLEAFHYMEELIDCITISEEVQDEIPE